MDTEMTDIMTDDIRLKDLKRSALKEETSLESVSETVAFLLSYKSGSITGQVMHVDSGAI